MTDELTDLNGEWAWSQVEALADDSLEGAALERMGRALESDPRLRRAVARARSVRRELGRLPKQGPPLAFLIRLLQTPPTRHDARRRRIAIPAVGALAVATIVAGVAVWIGSAPAPEPTAAQTAAAMQQLELALHYMRKSAAITHEELNAAVGHGLREALNVSRESVRDRGQENGG
jgi:ferric-dicitrate binding protein FerR (iron transport regulator)